MSMDQPTTATKPRSRPRAGIALTTYVAFVIALGAGLLFRGWTGIAPGATPPPMSTLAFWLVLSLAAECFWLETPTRRGMISMSLAVNLATLFILPAHLVLTVAALSVGLSDLFLHRRGLLKALFNSAQTVAAMAASLATIRLLGGASPAGAGIFLERPLAALAAPVSFFVVNTFLVAGVIGISARVPFGTAWRENFGFAYQFLSSGTLFLVAVTLVIAVQSIGFISGLLYVLFFFFVRDAYNRFVRDRSRRPA